MRVTRARALALHDGTHEVSDAFKNSMRLFEHTESPPDGSARAKTETATATKRRLSTVEHSSPSPSKKRRESSRYAPPSKYAHLQELQDVLQEDLIAIFVGFNPGLATATQGHAYAHPSNLFWKLLHSSGLTDRRWRPQEDRNLPSIGLGNTNLVSRPTKDAAQLSKAEMTDATPALEAKVRKYKPEAVCIVGKSIWEAIWRHRHGRNPKPTEFRYGWQDEKENLGRETSASKEGAGISPGARVFVTTSTSGLSASLKPAEKAAIWRPFGDWVNARREARAVAAPALDTSRGHNVTKPLLQHAQADVPPEKRNEAYTA